VIEVREQSYRWSRCKKAAAGAQVQVKERVVLPEPAGSPLSVIRAHPPKEHAKAEYAWTSEGKSRDRAAIERDLSPGA